MTEATSPEAPPAPNPLRLVVTLSLVGLASALALAGTYLATRPRIEQNRAEALERAVLTVVPGAATLSRFIPDAPVYAARDDAGRLRGFAIVAEGPGFADTIRLIYGFDPVRRRVVGMRVLESRETPGLGDRVVTDGAFVGSFDDLAVTPAIVAVGSGKATRDNEVDCITGATISSRAVVGIVQQSLETWLGKLSEPSEKASEVHTP
jgi:electron transport complex protein RnfG